MSEQNDSSGIDTNDCVTLQMSDDVATIVLRNGAKHNSLTRPLLEQLNRCLSEVSSRKDLSAVVIQAEGRSFSTGGDIKAFYENIDDIENYSRNLVGLLNQAIMQMLRLSTPIITRVQGPVTGGSFGLVLASDLVVMADSAFIAPYYVDVGFAPDGGWVAILPDRIGQSRAKEVQFLNSHINASTALSWGLVNKVAPKENLDTQVEDWTTTLQTKVSSSVRATKRGIQNEALLSRYQNALDNELIEFIKLAKTPEAKAGMEKFLSQF